MKKVNIKEMTVYAMVAAIYVVLTLLLGSLSYNGIQFRIAEALILLCFYNKRYCIPLTIGCLVANLFSPFGLIDVLFGTIATVIALIGIMFSKNLLVASIYPVIANGIIVSIEICFIDNVWTWGSFFLNFGTVALGEFVCVCVLGVILFTCLSKNKGFMNLINANQNYHN